MSWLPFFMGWVAVCSGWSLRLRHRYALAPDGHEPLYHAFVWGLFGNLALLWWTVWDTLR